MLRPKFQEELKNAMQTKDAVGIATVRLIIAAMKDRDIAARSKGKHDGIADDEILSMMQGMIKQRRESIVLYEKGGRQDLVDRETAEIAVIERFLPKQMSNKEVETAITSAILGVGACGIKDMGKVMNELKTKFVGQMDFTKVSAEVKEKLSALS